MAIGVLLTAGGAAVLARSRELPSSAWVALAAFGALSVLVLLRWHRPGASDGPVPVDRRLSVLRAHALSRRRVLDVPSAARLLAVSHLEARQLLRLAVRLRWAEVVETDGDDVAYRFHASPPRDRLIPRP